MKPLNIWIRLSGTVILFHILLYILPQLEKEIRNCKPMDTSKPKKSESAAEERANPEGSCNGISAFSLSGSN